jgi:putative transcriptional regulator
MARVTPLTLPGDPAGPTHVIGDELLMDYAAGACAESVALIVASHLTLCPEARQRLSVFEDIGGTLLDDIEPAAMSDDALDALLDRLDADDEAAGTRSDAGVRSEDEAHRRIDVTAAVPDRDTAPADPRVPAPLAVYLPDRLERLAWKPVMRGLDEVTIDVDAASVKLLRIKGGTAVPRHTHGGTEMTLVLTGGFADERGHFLRGDVAVTDSDVNHRPVADPGEDCICLTVTDAPLKLTGPLSRFLNPFVRF